MWANQPCDLVGDWLLRPQNFGKFVPEVVKVSEQGGIWPLKQMLGQQELKRVGYCHTKAKARAELSSWGLHLRPGHSWNWSSEIEL